MENSTTIKQTYFTLCRDRKLSQFYQTMVTVVKYDTEL